MASGVWSISDILLGQLNYSWPIVLGDLFNSDFLSLWTTGHAPNTYIDGPAHGKGSSAFNGGVLTPSGDVVLVPVNSANIGIYDPVADTYTDGATHGKGSSAFLGGVLTLSGDVVLVPHNSANIGIFSGGASVPTSTDYATTGAYLNKF